MNQRTADDLKHELQALDSAHAQNEAARDSFVALSHTALFAASVSFVGSAVPLAKAVWPYALIAGWAIDVLGLLALTVSFATARKDIDARRAALYDETPPAVVWSDRLNGFALWSFPAALVCLFSFVTANVVHINEREAKSTTRPTTVSIRRISGDSAPTTRTTTAGRGVSAADGRCSSPSRTGCTAAPSAPAPSAASPSAASQKIVSAPSPR